MTRATDSDDPEVREGERGRGHFSFYLPQINRPSAAREGRFDTRHRSRLLPTKRYHQQFSTAALAVYSCVWTKR